MPPTTKDNAALIRQFLSNGVAGKETDAGDDVVATDGVVPVRAMATGVHCESLMDLMPTSRSFEVVCAWVCRIEDGYSSESHSRHGRRSLVQELDAIAELPVNRSLTNLTDHLQP